MVKPKYLFILSHKDRYAELNGGLLNGPTLNFLEDEVIHDKLSNHYVRLNSDTTLFPTDFTHTVLFGYPAMRLWTGEDNINAWRGYIHTNHPMFKHCVATYNLIDAVDLKDYEGNYDTDDDEDAASTGKDTAPTSRRNFRFWLMKDVEKLTNPDIIYLPDYTDPVRIITSSEITKLFNISGQTIYLDIETNPDTDTLQCIGLAVNDEPVISIIIYDHEGQAVTPLPRLIAGLVRLISRNRVVIHNAMFDLPYMAINYHIPFSGNVYDTMAAQHRIYPEAEKSLAHAISLWVNSPPHKGTGVFNPHSRSQLNRLLTYNAKDVYTLRAIYKAQQTYIAKNPSVRSSVDQVNSSFYSYALAGILGIDFDPLERMRTRERLSKDTANLERVLRILTGINNFNPGSPKMCINYFHELMHYDVVARTPKGEPSLKGLALYKILLAHPENPVAKIIIYWRKLEKQLSMLNFIPLPL